MNPIKTRIVLHKLELSIHLGWPESERLLKQNVMVDIDIHFSEPPRACLTDQLEDTYSYETLSNAIKEKITSRQFRLIEHLGHEIYQHVKILLPKATLVTICITKKPPILNLAEVSFWYGDN